MACRWLYANPAGHPPPTLVTDPAAGAWRRSTIVGWLLAEAERSGPVLAGFDFAFAFPFCDGGAYMPGSEFRGERPGDLWGLIDMISLGEPEYYAGAFVDDGRFGDAFWRHGPRPQRYTERCRLTERKCREQGLGSPETVFKLIGSKQVGKGSLAGMRVLNRLKRQGNGGVRVWPFDSIADGKCVCVEIFPRQFIRRAGLGGKKLRGSESLDLAMRHFACDPMAEGPDGLNDHQTNALISAAALRWLAAGGAAWRPPSMTACARVHEGWIFGVS